MKITLKDIASDTGYSVSTVSRVLSNSDKISSATREEILEAAVRLGYRVGRLPVTNGKKRKMSRIALICDFHLGEFYASFINGFFITAHEQQTDVHLINVFNPREEAEPCIKSIIQEDFFDGIIIMLPELEKEDYIQITRLIPKGYPILSNALIDNPLLTTLTFDGYSGGYQAGTHLREQGYKRFGIVRGPGFKPETRFRHNGFKDFVSSTSDTSIIWEFEGNYQYDDGIRAFNSYIKLADKPEAVFLSNDLMAFGFLNAAHRAGLSIPGDVAIMGYDNLPTCELMYPGISSVKTDFIRLGNMSINAIKSMYLQKEELEVHTGMLSFVPVEVVARQSTAPKISK
ncbi:MAG: LacI family transcriptional regulator [Balneolales bacterium]|nr:LacI family transcriptional regulator [Balneolales bacterium]